MNSRSGFTARACVLLVLGATTLASCRGGGSLGDTETGPQIVARAPDIEITPEAGASPEAIGAVPAQTLTAGGDPSTVEIAPYFQDPDNDPLTYSAESSDPGAVTAGMSGTTLTLTPVSAGEATVTVTAGDGMLEATQTIAVTVQEPDPETTLVQEAESTSTTTPTPTPPPPPPSEPEIVLTGIDIGVRPSDNGRRATLTIRLVPEGAQLTVLDFLLDPYEAGRFSSSTRIGNTRYIRFTCANRFHGDVTITLSMQRTGVEESVQFTCQ